MEIRISEADNNIYPLNGLLIRGASLADCIMELQHMELAIADVEIRPIPGALANSIWGYLIVTQHIIPPDSRGKHQLCQYVCRNLMIPERSRLSPLLLPAEMDKLFASAMHVAHPDFGWVELSEPLKLLELIEEPVKDACTSIRPASSSFVPMTIRSFRIHPMSPEEVLENLNNNPVGEQKRFEDAPLNLLEQMRLKFYQLLFQKTDSDKSNDKGSSSQGSATEGSASDEANPSIFRRLFKSLTNGTRLQQDFNDLEERNKKSVDKLMDLLRKNPLEGLQYAIPLGESGVTRGNANAGFDLSKRWFDFSWQAKGASNAGSGSAQLGDHFSELQQQYRLTADELIKNKDHQKAAFVYLKLLKDYRSAAQTLEAGKHYQDAATIYLKHLGDKMKAAECYENGNCTLEAIDLYIELNQHEKAGDLYCLISNRREALVQYEKVVSSYKAAGQYVKASLICKYKINNAEAGQAMLLEGWRQNKDAVNCLNNYFSNIEDSKQFNTELNAVYRQDVTAANADSFLEAIRHEYLKRTELREPIMEMAYEVVSKNIPTNPNIVSELKNFNVSNKELFKDTLRFKLQTRSRK
ncbi:hypothetical protein WBG78_27590 [Chryseolinea sp. T2]|uniref:hypothetical protein n=1 Tax=Chryseolinea sp. T2 TaxID=3129255 RepID=UPI0030785703